MAVVWITSCYLPFGRTSFIVSMTQTGSLVLFDICTNITKEFYGRIKTRIFAFLEESFFFVFDLTSSIWSCMSKEQNYQFVNYLSHQDALYLLLSKALNFVLLCFKIILFKLKVLGFFKFISKSCGKSRWNHLLWVFACSAKGRGLR